MEVIFENWYEKLLDIGKGNKLINFREGKQNLSLIFPSATEVFEKLSGGDSLSVFDIDGYLQKIKDNLNLSVNLLEPDQIISTVSSTVKSNQIVCFRKSCQTHRILKNLKKNSGEFLTEKGINILYAAFGLLKWTDEDNELQLSPLVLVPVTIRFDPESSSYSITKCEDEIVTNPTLKFKLSSFMNFELPEYRQEGYEEETLEQYFERLSAKTEQKGWEVILQSVIDTFSFLKINMYKDLKENEKKILQNPLVRALLGADPYRYMEIFPNEEMLESELHNVVDADASQRKAILMAKKGNSFVLQGPPGTGKSQTITNIIAELLMDKKRILFVSEKLAALSVVYNNLKKVGLSEYCLQLHSNKANKKEVITDLYSSLTSTKKFASGSETLTETLLESERKLDGYVKKLHEKIMPINKTPYEIIGEISKVSSAKLFDYNFLNIETKDENFFNNALNKLEIYNSAVQAVGDACRSPFYGLLATSMPITEKVAFEQKIRLQYNFLNEFLPKLSQINDYFGEGFLTYSSLVKSRELIGFLLSEKFFDKFFFSSSLAAIYSSVKAYNDHNFKLKKLENELFKLFKPTIFELDVTALAAKYENQYDFLTRVFGLKYKEDRKKVNAYLAGGKTGLGYKKTKKYLKIARDIFNLRRIVAQDEDSFFNLLSVDKGSVELDYPAIQSELFRLTSIDLTLAQNLQNLENSQIAELVELLRSFAAYCEANKESFIRQRDLQTYFGSDIFDLESVNFFLERDKFEKILNNFGDIEAYIRLNSTLVELEKLGLSEFTIKATEKEISGEKLISTFKLMFYSELMDKIIATNDIFYNFSRMSQDLAENNFRKNDKLKFEANRAEIISKLSQSMPDLNSLTSGSQVAELAREANKKIKQKPLRVLLKETGELIQTLRPCFLMSPVSVSTYLDYDSIKFDTIIFDEASQIFPFDAIGAISRANQVIIVGDSKQMPPTDFFTSRISADETDTEDESTDFESVLDLGQTCLPQCRLNWHYRSKTEELIAFSNYNFYDNKLTTFPSINKDNPDYGIHFHYVDGGTFSRTERSNRKEAEEVVNLVFEHIEKFPERSLGVVAFSISQQELIEDIIEKRRAESDEYSKFFDSDCAEPFFVKNLETVQGDERDTIIFSVAYAPDETGRFIHNFGPLSKVGGERRLNVAITRAKISLELVSSIKYSNISLDKITSEGGRLLRDYLFMAEVGAKRWIEEKNVGETSGSVENMGTEREICEFLRSEGYGAELSVGLSDVKIDIAVKLPGDADYSVIIESDGDTYRRGETTRDRDRLRQEVFESLGWKYYRIWTLDWLLNKSFEKKRLISFLENSKSAPEEKLAAKESEPSETFLVEKEFTKIELRSLFPIYEEYEISNLKNPTFEKVIYSLVKKEQPICEELLLKKVAPLFGREKVTSAVRELFFTKMENFSDRIFKIKDYYVTDKDLVISMRIPAENSPARDIMYICDDELISGIMQVIKSSFGINQKALFNSIAGLLGFSKVGTNIFRRLSNLLETMVGSGAIRENNGEYSIVITEKDGDEQT